MTGLVPCALVAALASLLTQRAGCRRNANLQRRVDKKVETKKAKREKKLMRPGFEGRRDTFL